MAKTRYHYKILNDIIEFYDNPSFAGEPEYFFQQNELLEFTNTEKDGHYKAVIKFKNLVEIVTFRLILSKVEFDEIKEFLARK